jgi:predicted Zn finger-like uncharacterized protein
MRIACPSCGAAYDVADSLLPAGRTVQCARCSKAWVPVEPPRVDEPEQVPPEPPAKLKPDSERAAETDLDSPRLTAVDRFAQRERPPRPSGGAALRVFWAVSIVVVLGLLWGAYAWRADIMAYWPESVRVYSLLGLTAPQH